MDIPLKLILILLISMSPFVSIIIPCYNNQDLIQDAIASALSQTYPHIEVLVIDDGSTDGTTDILRTLSDRIYWETQPNQGAPTARNRGLALAKGTYIKFLDADDVLLPDAIERQIQQSQQIPSNQKAIVHGEALWVDQNLQPITSYSLRSREANEDLIHYILTACPLTSCPLHRRDYLLEINGFDPTLPRGQEHDLHLRLALADVEFIYHPEPVYQYRNYAHSDRISNHALTQKGALVQYHILQRQQALIEAKLGDSVTPEVSAAIARRYWQFGRGVLREGAKAAAQQYFQAAQALYPQSCVAGASPYPQLVRWFGPYRAEATMNLLKQIKSSFWVST